MTKNYADIAHRAADHMEAVGSMAGELWPDHAQGESYFHGDAVCMVGAIQVALGETDSNRDADYGADITLALADFVPKPSWINPEDCGGFAVSLFNDRNDHEQRVQMLRDFATKHESDEFRGGANNDTV